MTPATEDTAQAVTKVIAEAKRELSSRTPALVDLSHEVFGFSELRFAEHRSSARVAAYLDSEGFDVVSGVADMPTAFRARRRIGSGGPTIAIFCEYDALAGIGHACGHNLIATAGAGAAATAGALLAAENTPCDLVVLGSPAEEGGGGKVKLIEAGELEGVDVAIMVHPAGFDAVYKPNLGRISLETTFIGKASHAAASPDEGRNALDGATLFLSAIGLLRQQLRSSSRIHAIITEGGDAVNVIPERAKLAVFVRSPDRSYLFDRLLPAVLDCARGAALATGTTLEWEEVEPAYEPMILNPVLGDLAGTALEALGRSPANTDPKGDSAGSTDMGNVSHVVPSLHPYVCVVPGATTHTRDFAEAARSEAGDRAAIDGAAMLAVIAVVLARHPDLVDEAKRLFNKDARP